MSQPVRRRCGNPGRGHHYNPADAEATDSIQDNATLATETFDDDMAMVELRQLAAGDEPSLEQAIRTCLAQPANLATRHRAIELLARVRYEDAPRPA
jgi:hypothetical protein